MATVTLNYNARSSKSRAMLAGMLQSGRFTLADSTRVRPRSDNPLTLAALREAERGEYAGVVDTSSVEAMDKSIESDTDAAKVSDFFGMWRDEDFRPAEDIIAHIKESRRFGHRDKILEA